MSVHFIVKYETKNSILDKFVIEPQPEKKKTKFAPFILKCKTCSTKLGSDSVIGPNGEQTFCFRTEEIYFLCEKENGQRMKHVFNVDTKWKNEVEKFPQFDLRNFDTFLHGSDEQRITRILRTNFIPTIFPNETEVFNLNISELVEDTPRTYQIELFNSALFSNTIVYLPTGAGKTLPAAMLAAYMKKINPKKKVLFVCDRVPLVFQQASYLRYQTGLLVGEFCGEIRHLVDSQLNSDVLVFTCDFLINLIMIKKIYMEDFCCIVFDEIHHAHPFHSFTKLIENYYNTIKQEFRPRILGCKYTIIAQNV
jgi:hypothetical protein